MPPSSTRPETGRVLHVRSVTPHKGLFHVELSGDGARQLLDLYLTADECRKVGIDVPDVVEPERHLAVVR